MAQIARICEGIGPASDDQGVSAVHGVDEWRDRKSSAIAQKVPNLGARPRKTMTV